MTRPTASGTRKVPATLLVDLLSRLTDRDRAILDLVWEHRVLTTGQLAALFFHSLSAARPRLAVLHRYGALTRFRPQAQQGTHPYHWALGPAGAHIIAAQRGIEVKDLRYRQDKAIAFFLSQRLGHQIGVNDFFVRLHAYARRRRDGTAVAEWWHEHRCARLWGDHVRPDAFGRWVETGPEGRPVELDFFLEHDTGSYALSRVAAKLEGYLALAESTGIPTPVLFWLPTPAREANLRKALGTPPVPVATAVHTPPSSVDGPAGAVWLPVGVTGPRRRLAALAHAWDAPDRPRA